MSSQQNSSPVGASPSLYPDIDKDIEIQTNPQAPEMEREIEIQTNSMSNQPFESSEEVLIRVPGAIVHLIDKQTSVQLASGELNVVRLRQGENVVAVLARVGDEVQWPLARDEAVVKLDNKHYFFTLRVPQETGSSVTESENLLNYGLTVEGSEDVIRGLDAIFGEYGAFSVKEVAEPVSWDGGAAAVPPEVVAAAYWTTLAPNVEEYSNCVARTIAAGSGQLIKGILWCGDVTVDGLKWGNELLKKRVAAGAEAEISPQAMRRMERVKKMTKMTEDVATGILSGVVKVSGFFTSSIVNSKVGQKFFSLLPGEIVLASLDGFNKVFDAVEVAGRNVMSTTAIVTTGLVSRWYGEQAAKVANEGLDAAGHAIGTAWAVFKIRKALNPKNAMKPSTFVKAAAREAKSAKLKSK